MNEQVGAENHRYPDSGKAKRQAPLAVDEATAKEAVPDLETHGNPFRWVTLCKARSRQQGWTKVTKLMDVPGGVLVHVEALYAGYIGPVSKRPSEHQNSMALVFVPGTTVKAIQN